MRHKRKKQLSFERSLPSFAIEQPVEGQMEVSGLFCIEPSRVAVEVSTTLGGTTDIEVCAGSTFQEMFSELACTNYEIDDVIAFLKQQPEWEEIEDRIKNEATASVEKQKKEEEDRKNRDKQHLEWLSQILASDPSNRYQFGWRRIFSSERAIRVFLRVDKQEHSISEMFGAKPYDVAFDSVKNEFEGKIDLPSASNGNPSNWTDTFPHKFKVGVDPVGIAYLQRIP
jgi:hypothetical protein